MVVAMCGSAREPNYSNKNNGLRYSPDMSKFDIQVLNIISVKDAEIIERLHVFDPVNMLIDRTTGKFNGLMNLIKDQVVALNQFGKLGYENIKNKICGKQLYAISHYINKKYQEELK